MPVARNQGHGARAAIFTMVALVLLAGGLFAAASWLSGNESVELNLGDDVFNAGEVDRISAEIEDGGPLLFGDVAGRAERDIIVQHLGDDPDEGWLAFDAREPGADRDCFAEWVVDEEHFEDTCTGEVYPPDGDGLRQYDVTVRDGEVEVDLRS
jgi:hypothetical protein